MSLKNTKEWKKMRRTSINGCPARLREDSDNPSQSILTGWGSHANGIVITVCTIPKTILLQKLSRGISLIYITLIFTISRKLLNIIWKTLMIPITASSNSKQALLIKILHSKYSKKSGILLKSQGFRAFLPKVFYTCISISKSLDSEYDYLLFK